MLGSSVLGPRSKIVESRPACSPTSTNGWMPATSIPTGTASSARSAIRSHRCSTQIWQWCTVPVRRIPSSSVRCWPIPWPPTGTWTSPDRSSPRTTDGPTILPCRLFSCECAGACDRQSLFAFLISPSIPYQIVKILEQRAIAQLMNFAYVNSHTFHSISSRPPCNHFQYGLDLEIS